MIVTNLLTNMIVLALGGTIPTNTPALREYALHTTLVIAEAAAHKWRLDQTLITTNKVTRFEVVPYVDGVSVAVVFAGRYMFSINRERFPQFVDRAYSFDVQRYEGAPQEW